MFFRAHLRGAFRVAREIDARVTKFKMCRFRSLCGEIGIPGADPCTMLYIGTPSKVMPITVSSLHR